MLIAIPVDEDTTELKVCQSFGRAPYFLLQDTERATFELKKNPALEQEGGAGVKAAQYLLDQNVQALITIRGGENAAEVLKAGEVEIYKAKAGTAKENLAAFAAGELEPLQHFHAGFLHQQ